MLWGGEAAPVHGEALANTKDHRAAGGHKRVPLGQETPMSLPLELPRPAGSFSRGADKGLEYRQGALAVSLNGC